MILTFLIASALPGVDKFFLTQAAQDNITELALVRYLRKESTNPAVKKACEVMFEDHTKQMAEIRKIAAKEGVALPSTPDPKQ